MKPGFQRKLVAVLVAALIMAVVSLPAFAAEGGSPNPAETQQGAQGEQTGLRGGTPLSKNDDPQVKRTILLYDCGADLETDAGLASYNLN